jgi:hemerythrin
MLGEKIPSSATLKIGERIGKGNLDMPFIVWTSGMSVDVKLLDNDHKKLAILINDLHDGVMAGSARGPLERLFDEIVAYSRLHFAHEEHFLDEAGYSGAEAHKQEHGHKIELVLEMQSRFRSGTTVGDDLEVLNQLKDWLVNHVQDSDQEFVAHLKATGVDSILAERDKPGGAAE